MSGPREYDMSEATRAALKPKGFFVRNAKKFPVVELFGPTIQGEGMMAGTVSHFIRLGGCGYRCTWCDSMNAVDPVQIKANAKQMNSQQIVQALIDLTPGAPSRPWVTLSGGDPCMHDLNELVGELGKAHYQIAVETQGQFFPEWLNFCSCVTVSPKPPSSGMDKKLDIKILSSIMLSAVPWQQKCLKVVIFTDEDLEFARSLHRKFPGIPFYLSVGTARPPEDERYPHSETAFSQSGIRHNICQDFKDLAEKVCKMPDLFDVHLFPQLHVLAWSHAKGV
jgi:7-carboxy-7-deazaguanine synthase